MNALLGGISIDARGNVDTWLPSRRKAISLSAKEAALTQAVLAANLQQLSLAVREIRDFILRQAAFAEMKVSLPDSLK